MVGGLLPSSNFARQWSGVYLKHVTMLTRILRILPAETWKAVYRRRLIKSFFIVNPGAVAVSGTNGGQFRNNEKILWRGRFLILCRSFVKIPHTPKPGRRIKQCLGRIQQVGAAKRNNGSVCRFMFWFIDQESLLSLRHTLVR